MAKAIPSSSELGTSNAAKICPPSSTWSPSISGISSLSSVLMTPASSSVMSRETPIWA